jgi:hypothetical protein
MIGETTTAYRCFRWGRLGRSNPAMEYPFLESIISNQKLSLGSQQWPLGKQQWLRPTLYSFSMLSISA